MRMQKVCSGVVHTAALLWQYCEADCARSILLARELGGRRVLMPVDITTLIRA